MGIKVLYIGGFGRSGTTVLDNVLGQLDGFFSAGELRLVWDAGMLDDRLCGCGAPLPECAVWRPVLGGLHGTGNSAERSSRSRLTRYPDRVGHWGRIWSGARVEPPAEMAQGIRRIYEQVAESTGCRVIIDSSKVPTYGALIDSMDGIDVYMLHVVRDPRGVAYSWQKQMRHPGRDRSIPMRRHGALRTAVAWSIWNWTLERYWRGRADRYRRLRYEDFMSDAPGEARGIVDWLSEGWNAAPFVDANRVRLGENHTVWGNPSRFKRGIVELSLDDEWRRSLTRGPRTLIGCITRPLLRRYGY